MTPTKPNGARNFGVGSSDAKPRVELGLFIAAPAIDFRYSHLPATGD